MNTSRRIPRQLVKALAAGAVLFAAALPMVVASAAGAATLTTATFTPHGATANTIGTGASGTFSITGVGFAADGSTTTVTSTAPGLTFTGVSETNSTTVAGSFTSTSATVPGNYTLTVTDDGGTYTSTTTAGGVVVDANPGVTTVAPNSTTQGNPPAAKTVVITGTGFVSGATVNFQNTTDGTKLASTDSGTGVYSPSTGLFTTGAQGLATEGGSGTTLSVLVAPTNSITGGTEAAGTYNAIIVNPDGGTTVVPDAFTVIPFGVTNVSPSALPFATTTADTTVTIAGAGFEVGASVSLSVCTFGSVVSSSVVSATSITAVIAVLSTTTTPQLCTVTVANNGAGDNGATYFTTGALGIGEASTVAATITATSATTGLVAGAPATTVTLTGTGLSQYSSALAFVGTGTATQTNVILSNPSGNTGTAVTFNVSASGTGAIAGPYGVVVYNDGTTAPTAYTSVVASNDFPAGVSVAGPAIASQSPVGIAVGAPVGTVITLTGTGFTATTNGSVVTAGGSLRGIVSYVSATSMSLVLTASPNGTDLTTPPSVSLTEVPSAGTSVTSAPFALKIDAPPIVTSLAYTVGTDVGVGAVAQQVTIKGTGFATGATVGSFVNGNGTADPDVTATVTSINLAGTAIVATIAIKAGDTNLADGYSVTNTDGGVDAVAATLSALVIGAGPTITTVSPATATPSGTTAFTITGTGFQTGLTVAASSDGTCGSATVVSATSVTVSCTLGAASSTPVTLIATNVDGGAATSAAVLTAAVPVVTGPHATHVNGSAVTGKTVTITISGSGFAGAPKITSNAAGTTAKVSHDTGKLLTVRISTKAKKGEHTLTIRNADGKSCKINYATKA